MQSTGKPWDILRRVSTSCLCRGHFPLSSCRLVFRRGKPLPTGHFKASAVYQHVRAIPRRLSRHTDRLRSDGQSAAPPDKKGNRNQRNPYNGVYASCRGTSKTLFDPFCFWQLVIPVAIMDRSHQRQQPQTERDTSYEASFTANNHEPPLC